MKVIFAKEVKEEAGHLLFRAFIAMDGQLSGQKISVPESRILEIWSDEKPLDSCLKHMRIIHGMLRVKIESNDFSISSDGVIQVNL
jgi:hypothetical protein